MDEVNSIDKQKSELKNSDDGSCIKSCSTTSNIKAYCVACGCISTVSTNTNYVTVKTEPIENELIDGYNLEPENISPFSLPEKDTIEAIHSSTEKKLFQQFCSLLGVKLTGIKGTNSFNWNVDKEGSVPSSPGPLFCQICRNRLEFLIDLQERLRESERNFNHELTEFKLMCQKSEDSKSKHNQAYKTDKIYVRIRNQICGKHKRQQENCSENLIPKRATRKSVRDAAIKSTRLETLPPKEQEEVSIKLEQEIPTTINHDDTNDVNIDLNYEEPLESPPSADDYDDEPPSKKRYVKILPKKRSTVSHRLPLRNKKKSKAKRDKKPVSKSNRALPKAKVSKKTQLDVDYVPSEDDAYNNGDDSDEDIEASLKGRMTTDPTTGHVMFLHVSFKVMENGRYRCLTCNSNITYHRGSLKKHVITMHTDMFVCQECGQHCPSTKHLASHIRRVHRGEDRTTVECPVCGKPCSSKRGRMEKHMVTHMSNQEKEDAVARGETIPQWSKSRRHVCEECGMCYEMRSYLIQHKIREHPNEEYTQDEKLACKEMCPDCGKLVHKHYLKKHQEIVHSEGMTKRFCCALCNKRFSKANDLRKHKNVVHDKIKPFACSLCPKQFALRNQLNYHMDNHKNIRPFECDHCHMAFARKHHLERHVKTYHEPGANPKRKTYVRGPETKAKSEEEKARGHMQFRERWEGRTNHVNGGGQSVSNISAVQSSPVSFLTMS